MLKNFMDLVTAVEIAGMLVTSPSHCSMYSEHMQRYLEGMKGLYKEARVVPNHHLALHVPEFLQFFGPTHAHRTFALERFNYTLQKTNTNQKFGMIILL